MNYCTLGGSKVNEKMTNRTQRIYALDALRAIMMMLGLVFHSAISYCVEDQGATWPLKDSSSTSFAMDYLVGYIHIFRMPVFFVVAGFFGALLFYERSPVSMLRNRFKRILLPFTVFVFLLWPILGGSYLYTFEAFTGAAAPEAGEAFHLGLLIPQSSFHLWFLEYLFIISVLAFALAFILQQMPQLTSLIKQLISSMLTQFVLKVAISCVAVFLVLLIVNQAWVETTNALMPNWKTLLFYSNFYLFGWCLFKAKDQLNTFKDYDWALVFFSLLIYAIILVFKASFSLQLLMFLNALTVSACLFGITGLFIRYWSHESLRMRYVSDASYWVYLIHMPMTLLGPGLLAPLALPAFAKFLLVMIPTGLVAFITYHYGVRSTFVGKFLNGKKYPAS